MDTKTLPKTQYEILKGSPDTNLGKANEIRREDDNFKELNIGLIDIDNAIKYYFDNVIKPEVLDGLHRAIAASRAGIDIPVNVLDERHQQPMRGATYNLSTEHEYNPAFAKPKSRRRR